MSSVYRSRRGERAVRDWCERRLDRWSTPHERAEIDTAAGRTHLVVAGAGAATVVYLPGTSAATATSLPLADALASRVRVAVADLPGQPGLSAGQRPTSSRLRTYGAWAGEVVEWVGRTLGGGPLVLAGHSLGAAVALSAPTAGVTALVLLDPAGLVRLKVPRDVLRTTLPWWLRPTEPRSAALLRHLTGPGHSPDPALAEWMTLVARHTRLVGAPGPLPPALTARWQRTRRAVVSGECDCFLPPGALAPVVADRLGVELVVLPRLGHRGVEEDPAGVAAVILGALNVPPAPGR